MNATNSASATAGKSSVQTRFEGGGFARRLSTSLAGRMPYSIMIAYSYSHSGLTGVISLKLFKI